MPSKSKKIRIAVFNGSLRTDNYTGKVLAFAIDELRSHPDVELDLFDPKNLPLVFADQPFPPEIIKFQKTVSEVDGVLMATPEYIGSYSSVIKLLLENLGYPSVLAGKPAAMIGVATGGIGAIKSLEHLRGVLSHIGCLVLPQVVSVARVHQIFDATGRCQDPVIEKRIRQVAAGLVQYLRR
jgi:NAD(P)H-dependent FMN reductase